MAITTEFFEENFIKMASLLNKTVNKHQMVHWLKKVKDFHPPFLEEAVDICINSGKFPDWPEFNRVYSRVKSSTEGKTQVGCEFCKNGFVFYFKKPRIYKHGGEVQASMRCKICNPDRFGRGYDAHLNERNLKLIDFSTPYPHGQIFPEHSKPVQTAPEPQNLKQVIQSMGKQVNEPKPGDQGRRAKSLEKDAEADLKSGWAGVNSF